MHLTTNTCTSLYVYNYTLTELLLCIYRLALLVLSYLLLLLADDKVVAKDLLTVLPVIDVLSDGVVEVVVGLAGVVAGVVSTQSQLDRLVYFVRSFAR